MSTQDTKQPLAQCRKKAGLTIKEFADLLKVNRATVMRWEKGSHPIPIKRLDEVSTMLGVRKVELRPDLLKAIF